MTNYHCCLLSPGLRPSSESVAHLPIGWWPQASCRRGDSAAASTSSPLHCANSLPHKWSIHMRQLNSRTERENQPDLLAGGSIMTTAQTIHGSSVIAGRN